MFSHVPIIDAIGMGLHLFKLDLRLFSARSVLFLCFTCLFLRSFCTLSHLPFLLLGWLGLAGVELLEGDTRQKGHEAVEVQDAAGCLGPQLGHLRLLHLEVVSLQAEQ
jgi:hypothetical protein